MAGQPIHDNPTRSEWQDKIGALTSVKDATALIQNFRKENTGPFRTSYKLDNDYLFIEAKIEERLSVLKLSAFSNDDLFNKATTGESVQSVHDHHVKKADTEKNKFELEKLLVHFRQQYKPPVLPVNAFFKIDAHLGTRLMEARNTNYYEAPLEQLRKERGVKVLHLGTQAAL